MKFLLPHLYILPACPLNNYTSARLPHDRLIFKNASKTNQNLKTNVNDVLLVLLCQNQNDNETPPPKKNKQTNIEIRKLSSTIITPTVKRLPALKNKRLNWIRFCVCVCNETINELCLCPLEICQTKINDVFNSTALMNIETKKKKCCSLDINNESSTCHAIYEKIEKKNI